LGRIIPWGRGPATSEKSREFAISAGGVFPDCLLLC